MKLKALSRSQSSTTRETIGDLRLHHRNLDPTYHPHQRSREYTRAITSAKIDRMFAKPFLGALEGGHRDGITAACTGRHALAPFLSGSGDGDVRVWDLGSRKLVTSLSGAHSRMVTGLVFANGPSGGFYSCSDDGTVKSWTSVPLSEQEANEKDLATRYGPYLTFRSPTVGSFKSIDHHRSESLFATASDSSVDVWSPDRSVPVQSYKSTWGSSDTSTVVRYNPAERSLVGQCSMDRGVGLFDTRFGTPLQKTVLAMKSNCLEWNPMEPMNFVVGNDDHNAYFFDLRNLSTPTKIFKGHVGPILSVSFSPTGTEFVSGSYDKSVRIWPIRSGRSREIYHTKRMQKVFTVNYTSDNNYVLSGSDDFNIRLWKARASEKIGQLSSREESAVRYRHALIQKYKNLPEVKKVHSARRVPGRIKKMTATAQVQKESRDRKQANRAKYDRKGTDQFVGDRRKVVVKKVD